MQKVMITCPFTGLEFEAIEFADGSIIATNKITGEDMRIGLNPSCNRYMIDKRYIRHVPMVTMEECAEFLEVSKPRISKLVKDGRLQTVKPSAALYITRDSMLDYKRHQKELAEKDNDGGIS